MGTNTASMRNTVSLLFHIIEVTLQTNLFGLLLSHKTLIHIQKMRRKIYLIAMLSALFFTMSNSAMACKKDSIFIRVDGKLRNMIVFTPDNMKENLPLMIVTHGMNQDPYYQYCSDKFPEIIDKELFVVAYLRSNGSTWDTGGTSDQHFVEQTIGEMYTRHKIDAHRVYWSGFSMGSMLMYHCMANMTGKIAAFCPCSGIQFSEQPWNRVKGPINLIHCHAYGDDVFNYNQYGIRDYVKNMVKVNGESTYEKTTNYYTVYNWNTGDKEVWTNAQGYRVELYSYNNGGHWPTKNNAVEIWNFCKDIRLENIDAIPEPEQAGSYTVDAKDEKKGDADKLNGLTLFATDADLTSLWYVNNGLESPQNIRSGSYKAMEDNDYFWLKFRRITNAGCDTQGNLYTIQMVDKSGSNYSLWGKQGYMNTPPGAWCLFALGLEGNNGAYKYGEDANYTGLWKVEYEDEHGYVIQNVNTLESNGNSYISPAYDVPQANKCYVRLFTKLVKASAGIETISAITPKASAQMYDIMGQRISTPQPGTIYIVNGKKFIQR